MFAEVLQWLLLMFQCFTAVKTSVTTKHNATRGFKRGKEILPSWKFNFILPLLKISGPFLSSVNSICGFNETIKTVSGELVQADVYLRSRQQRLCDHCSLFTGKIYISKTCLFKPCLTLSPKQFSFPHEIKLLLDNISNAFLSVHDQTERTPE